MLCVTGAFIHILMVSQSYMCCSQRNVGALLDIHCQDRGPGPLVTNYVNPSRAQGKKKVCIAHIS